jgi:ferredoxin
MTAKVLVYFPSDKLTTPITYNLVKDFDLMINILHADIQPNKTGKLIADISGTKENLEKGLDFINRQGLEYKLFTKKIIWSEENCVHCGACTAVCPSGALKMERDTWTLTFNSEKCLICEFCVKACPLNVMSVSI